MQDFFGGLLRNSLPNKGERPFINQVFITSGGRFSSYTNYFTGFTFRRFWQWFRTRPELYSILSIPVNDTIGAHIEFTDLDGMPLKAKKRNMVQKFWDDNQMKQVMKGIEFDCLLTGNGFGWIGRIPDDVIEKELDKLIGLKHKESGMTKEMLKFKVKQMIKYNSGMPKSDYNQYYKLSNDVDDDLSGPKAYMQIPASTMDIISNAYEVQYYVQRVGGKEQRFDKNEIIHFILERLDGRVEGFTPISTMVAEMFLIQMIKDNMIAFFENGGHPSKIYSLPDVKTVGDPNYKRIVDILSESKTVLNSNGSIIYPGKIDVNDLGALPKDMEYKDLAMYVLSNMAFAYEIPTSRLPFLLSGSGGAVNKGGTAGLSDVGYWKRIENRQNYLEDTYNRWLFKSMGVKMKIPSGNKQDKIRDTQARVQQYDSVDKLQNILMRGGIQLKNDSLFKLLDLGDDDVDVLTADQIMANPMMGMGGMPPTGTSRQNGLNTMQTLNGQPSVDKSVQKQETASNGGVYKEQEQQEDEYRKKELDIKEREIGLMLREKNEELIKKQTELVKKEEEFIKRKLDLIKKLEGEIDG